MGISQNYTSFLPAIVTSAMHRIIAHLKSTYGSSSKLASKILVVNIRYTTFLTLIMPF